jgi:uncharacterized protein (TIGR00255 family)
MTGYAQRAGTSGRTRWTWDVKSVNAKGLDLRLRLPPACESLDIDARRCISARLARGTCHATLSLVRDAAPATTRIDTERLAAILAAIATLQLPATVGPATLDGLLALRGVVETVEDDAEPAGSEDLLASCARGLDDALADLVAMREREGAALADLLRSRLSRIAALVRQADEAPQRTPEAIRARLAESVARLGEAPGLDGVRLHAEAVLLAAKADVREELDRLAAHADAAGELLTRGGPVGRRLDFLAQELGREASTFCAKVNDAALTAIGLELRAEIEQFREQVQNIE